jgi:hypothetical protein
MALINPLKNSAIGQYEEPVDVNSDSLSANGFFPQNATSNDTAVGVTRDVSNNIVLTDAVSGSKTLTQILNYSITAAQHKTLLQLIHFIDEGPAEGFTTGATKTTTGTVFPTQNLWKRSDATKLVEQNITWTGVKPTTIQWKVYDTNGTTVLATVTDTITYSGIFETGRSRSIA